MNYSIEDTQPIQRVAPVPAGRRFSLRTVVAVAGASVALSLLGAGALVAVNQPNPAQPAAQVPIVAESSTPDVQPIVITTTKATVPARRAAVPAVQQAASQSPVTVTRTRPPVTSAPTTPKGQPGETETSTVTATLPTATDHTSPTNPTATWCAENPDRC